MVKTNQDIIGRQCLRNDDGCWESVIKIRKELVKVVMKTFCIHNWYGIGIVYLRQMQLVVFLA